MVNSTRPLVGIQCDQQGKSWAGADFDKSGFENLLPVPKHALYVPRVVTLAMCLGGDKVFA